MLGLDWYLRPLLVPPPLGSCFLQEDKGGTFKGSELREQRFWQAWWLKSGQRDSLGSWLPGPVTATLVLKIPHVPAHHCTEPLRPLPQDFQFSSLSVPTIPT